MDKCSICGGKPDEAFSARVLGKYSARYWYCPACQFLCTPSPVWLDEAYADAISRADTGLVARNLDLARKTACVLFQWFDPAGRYLDTAGGTGLLTRMLRDVGFKFEWEDPYCENVMARGFEAPTDAKGYEAVTAFEVMEHLENPLEFVHRNLQRSTTGTLLFTTELFEGRPPAADWWYYSFNTGQHISFFTRQTLARMAQELGVNFFSARGLHLFTRKSLQPWQYRWTLWRSRGALYKRVCRAMPGLTEADHRAMLGDVSRAT